MGCLWHTKAADWASSNVFLNKAKWLQTNTADSTRRGGPRSNKKKKSYGKICLQRPKQGCEVPQRRQNLKKQKKVDRRKVAHDGRPKFRKARDTVEAKRSRVFLGKANLHPKKKQRKEKKLQWSFANCLRRSAVKIPHTGKKSYLIKQVVMKCHNTILDWW